MTYQLIMVPIILLLFVGSFVYQRRMMTKARADAADYMFRDFAARVQLEIVEGNPYQNLMFAQMDHAQAKQEKVKGGLFGSEHTKESQLRAEGRVWDRDYFFEMYQRTDVETEFNTTTTTSTFGVRFAAHIDPTIPPFEVHVRNYQKYATPEIKTSLPPQLSGNSALDEIFLIKCDDPAIAAALVPALVPLMTQATLHIVSGDGLLRALGTRYTYAYLVQAGVEVQRGLEHIACIAEGRDAAHLTG